MNQNALFPSKMIFVEGTVPPWR